MCTSPPLPSAPRLVFYCILHFSLYVKDSIIKEKLGERECSSPPAKTTDSIRSGNLDQSTPKLQRLFLAAPSAGAKVKCTCRMAQGWYRALWVLEVCPNSNLPCPTATLSVDPGSHSPGWRAGVGRWAVVSVLLAQNAPCLFSLFGSIGDNSVLSASPRVTS